MSTLDDKIEQVYEMVVQSQQTGITIDQVARQLEGDILASYYMARLMIDMRIKSLIKGLGPAYYVAANVEDPFLKSK